MDGANRNSIGGWALNLRDPARKLVVRVFADGIPLGAVTADRFRADLQAAGIGDGHLAFEFVVPGGLAPERRHLIEVTCAEDGRPLSGSPMVVEASPAAAFRAATLSAAPAPWRGQLDGITRAHLEGWAWDERSPQEPIALVVLVNGEVLARVLANRYRRDLLKAGIGDGRHAFALDIPGGLSPLSRHIIQVVAEADGCAMPGTPVVLEAAGSFDASLERMLSASLAALDTPAQRDRALTFLVQETEKLLQQNADTDSAREARMIQHQAARRLGKARHQGEVDVVLGPNASIRRALAIDDRLPSADHHDAGAAALLSHLRALQSLGYEVSFVAAEELAPAGEAGALARAALESSGIHCCSSPWYASVEEVLRRQTDGFDLIYLHRLSNVQKYQALARHHARRARLVYSVAPELMAQSRSARAAEALAASAVDVVLTHSLAEASWLRQSVRGANVHVVPPAVALRAATKPWRERSGVAFIGDFSSTSSVDAARGLVNSIMPRVWREDPSIECLLVGSRMTAEIEQLAADKIKIGVLGEASNLDSVFERVRLTVALLRFGAGISDNVLASLAAGVPCAMSPVAAAGLQLPTPLAAAIGSTESDIAQRIERFHNDSEAANQVAQFGREFIRTNFAQETVLQSLRTAIEGKRVSAAGPVALAHLGVK